MNSLEKELFVDMQNIYRKASEECNYKPRILLDMLVMSNDPVQTAITLVSKEGGTDGFYRLWKLGRLDLSVEAVVLKEKYNQLFSKEVRSICKNRLQQYSYLEY